MIGGNTELALQTKTSTINEIGEREATWATVQTLKGWLDYQAGEAKHSAFNAKIQETTHVFICDYEPLKENISTEGAQAVVNGKTYDVLLIDDPMELHQQLEIYLKYTGGQNGKQ